MNRLRAVQGHGDLAAVLTPGWPVLVACLPLLARADRAEQGDRAEQARPLNCVGRANLDSAQSITAAIAVRPLAAVRLAG